MKKSIFLLHGEDAVNEYRENGADGCVKRGFNVVSKIVFDPLETVELFTNSILDAVSGSLDSCLIDESDYKIISK